MASSQQTRAEKAQAIIKNPCSYQVCEGCDSIVGASVVVCPNCHGYRFDDEIDRVIEQALELGSREQQSVTSEDLMS